MWRLSEWSEEKCFCSDLSLLKVTCAQGILTVGGVAIIAAEYSGREDAVLVWRKRPAISRCICRHCDSICGTLSPCSCWCGREADQAIATHNYHLPPPRHSWVCRSTRKSYAWKSQGIVACHFITSIYFTWNSCSILYFKGIVVPLLCIRSFISAAEWHNQSGAQGLIIC